MGDTDPPSIVEEELVLDGDDIVALDGGLGDLRDITVAEDHGNLQKLGDLDGLGCHTSASVAFEGTLYGGLPHPPLEDLVLRLVVAYGALVEYGVRH